MNKSGPESKVTQEDVLEMVRLRENCNRMPSEIAKKFKIHKFCVLEHIRKYHEGNHPLFRNFPISALRGGFQVFHMQKVENRETNY